MTKSCDNCEHLKKNVGICFSCHWCDKWEPKPISFRRLNGLKPTLQSCTLKVLEEVGELMQLLGKGRGASGEGQSMEEGAISINTAFEALDVAQAAVTLFNILVDEHGLEGEEMVREHEKKLREKGYLK